MTEISEEEKESNLYLCDCPDDGHHTNPSYHQDYCDYKTWLLFAQGRKDD